MRMYTILYFLYSSGAKSKLTAATQREIQEAIFKKDGEQLCDRAVYNNIRKLAKQGFIAEGLPRQYNAKSYHITAAGVAWMREIEAEECEDEAMKIS